MQNLLKISVGDQCQAMLTWFIALSLSKNYWNIYLRAELSI